MASVTQRIKEIKQPTGGYLNIKEFKCIKLKNLNELNPIENINPTLIGLAVDYLSRFMVTKDVVEAFKVSSLGAFLVKEKDKFIDLISDIKGLDNKSIIRGQLIGTSAFEYSHTTDPMYYWSSQTIVYLLRLRTSKKSILKPKKIKNKARVLSANLKMQIIFFALKRTKNVIVECR